MTEITRRRQFRQMPDFSDLMDPLQQLFGVKPQSPYGIRVETHYEQDTFVVRGELPGIDPASDVEVSVADGLLTLQAERAEKLDEQEHHTEFRYGSFSRTLRLPQGAKQDTITAAYHDGIITVRVPMDKSAKAAGRTIKVVAGK
jgi:HSP20 family protein